jgi:ubiquitin carboxyl-terminal hydrolase 10
LFFFFNSSRLADFVFGDFSEQETEKFFGHDKQCVKVNEPEFPWATDDCMTTTIEFGFDVPPVISPSGVAAVSYPNFNSCNGSSSHQESTSSALTSPPYSSKSSSVENLKITKQSPSSRNHHHSDRKLKKKRPPNYYRQEYQQMLEPSTLHQQQTNGQSDETTPTQIHSNEQTPQIEQNANESNSLLLSSNDERYISCDQWVHSTIKHQLADNDDDQSSSKRSTNGDDDVDSDGPGTTTDTDNDNDLHQSTSTTCPSYPVNIITSDQQSENKSNQNSSPHLLSTPNQLTNDLNIYSTSVASGASIETLKPSNNLSSPLSSPNKQNDLPKSKPTSWADLFRSQTSSASSSSSNTQTSLPPQTTSPVKKSHTTSTSSSSLTPTLSGTQISTILPQQQQNGNITPKTNTNNFYPKPNYHVYNSNGLESKSLDDYFSKCEIRPSAMAIKPRGLMNKNNYCYVNATFQALLACPAFFNVMKYIPLTEDPIDHNVPCMKAVHAFVNQFEKMDRSKPNTSNQKDIICGEPFDAIDILQEIARLRHISIDIVKTKQEDAHELLCQFLSEIHDEICSVLYNTAINKNEESLTTSDVTTTTTQNGEEKAEDWLQVGKRNRTHVLRTNEVRKSLIADIFAGKFRSTVHTAGNQKSVIHEPFFTLSLDIKDSKITTLDEALLRFCDQSTFSDYIDSKTRQNVHTNKTMLIEQLPPILIVHLKCFLYDELDGAKKIKKSISYTVNLTLPKSILTEQARKQYHERYKLFAVEYHQGDHATKGHYITDVFHPGLQGWLRFDDGNVHVVSSHQVINSAADKLMPYLLFYRRD